MTNNSRGTFPLAGILDDEYARILDNFTLVKTVVYKKKRIWNIYVNAGTYIDHEKIQLLEKHISAKFPQLAGIRFIVTYGDNGSEILEGNFSRIWIIICKLVKEELPSLNGWIDHCTPSLSGNTLKITINHPVALELFRLEKLTS